jgi:hypothetical protein
METIRGDKEAVRDRIAAAKAVGDRTLVTGLFSDRASAERAYDSVTLRGYRSDDVDIIMSDETRRQQFGDGSTTELGTKAPQGMVVGAAAGGALDALTAIGVPENTAIRYWERIRSGLILMIVRARDADDADYFVDEWIANEGQDIWR